MEWEAPAIVLAASSYGEGGAVAHVLSEEFGAYRGLVRGGSSRAQVANWQPGNLITARWVARLPEMLGNLTAELVHPSSARLLQFARPLAMLSSACAVADGALPEREAHPRLFHGLTGLLTLLSLDPVEGERLGPAALVRWEMTLLSELGYGLDLTECAVCGGSDDLAFVSPRSGRAVSEEGAGLWRERLLRLPKFLLDDADPGNAADWRDGLRLTGHFLVRDAFGQRHRPLPQARGRLYDMMVTLAETGSEAGPGS